MIPAVGVLLAKLGLPFLVDAAAGALAKVDHPAARTAAEALGGVGAALGAGEIPPDQIAEANRHLERMTEMELGADTDRIRTVNETMRVEAQAERWWVSGWRPFWGFVSAAAFLVVCGLVCWLAFQAVASRDAEALRMIPELVMSMSVLFGIPAAILGIASWHRGKEKRERLSLLAGADR
mgnify:CR=1 FL=1